MSTTESTRDQLGEQYLAQLPYPPYPVQEEALLAWFMTDQGVLVCAPTGTGKTLIAQAALYEALRTGTVAYYTTPLIALTEQKFQEIQAAAVRWGFSPEDVGLVTGHRRVNPQAKVLIVVAEILLNRLLNPEAFRFDNVSAVVMDEFHSFADQERGIVWELSLGLLPAHVRLLLLSATVGNSLEFLAWLERSHKRKLELVEGKERKVPLTYVWVADQLLNEQLVEMAKGAAEVRKTPALVFCFNRDECWSVAEQLKGLHIIGEDQKGPLHAEVNKLDWTQGVGPKIRQMLHRGVGVHHAGLLPKYRRVVEDLFERKLLGVAVCTETLAAGINLPARSVVLTSLVKGPPAKQKLIDASSAQQIFGRAGRPQYDDRGYVYAVAHEDDVKILRWKQKYDQIPETTKDPVLLKAKKELKRKKPARRENQEYWTEAQFQRLQAAPPGKLYSKGPVPWRLLAHLLKLSPDVERVRTFIRKRLMDEPRIKAALKQLESMLQTLAAGGFVTLSPEPPKPAEKPKPEQAEKPPENLPPENKPTETLPAEGPPPDARLQVDKALTARPRADSAKTLEALAKARAGGKKKDEEKPPDGPPAYAAVLATPTAALDTLLVFRSIHPLYGAFLVQHLGIADRNERIQALESVLEVPRPLLRAVRVPLPDDLAPGPLQTTRLDEDLIKKGLMLAPVPPGEDDEDDNPYWEPERPPTLADKLKLLFDAKYPEVTDVLVQSVWAAGELLRYGGDFNKYVSTRDLVKQEGIVFRHVLRFILLCGEFSQVCPPDTTPEEWKADLRAVADTLTASCRVVDPHSTEETVEYAFAPVDSILPADPQALPPPDPAPAGPSVPAPPPPPEEPPREFGAGIFD